MPAESRIKQMKLRPSSLPAIRLCGQYEAAPAGDAADRGTARHAALSALAAGDRTKLDALPDLDEREAVQWAHDYIKSTATAEEPAAYEHKLVMLDADFNEVMRGTPDCVAGPDLFDLKWFPADYSAQMAAYVVMRCQATGRTALRVHVLYGQTRKPYDYTLTLDRAQEIVGECMANTDKPPTLNEFCGWCKHQTTCPAILQRVEAVKAGREDWTLENYHSSQIADPAEMSKALRIARTLKDWAEAVEYHAKEMAKRLDAAGQKLPGFTIRQKAGRKYITDIAAAYAASALPQDKFLSCCDLRFTTSKTAPDKKGIEDVYAEFHGMKKAAAKRAVTEKLAALIKTNNPSLELRADTETKPETSE